MILTTNTFITVPLSVINAPLSGIGQVAARGGSPQGDSSRIGPPRHDGHGASPSATATAAWARRRVESSVGSGETSGVTRSGISAQQSATASHPSRFRPSMIERYAAR